MHLKAGLEEGGKPLVVLKEIYREGISYNLFSVGPAGDTDDSDIKNRHITYKS